MRICVTGRHPFRVPGVTQLSTAICWLLTATDVIKSYSCKRLVSGICREQLFALSYPRIKQARGCGSRSITSALYYTFGSLATLLAQHPTGTAEVGNSGRVEKFRRPNLRDEVILKFWMQPFCPSVLHETHLFRAHPFCRTDERVHRDGRGLGDPGEGGQCKSRGNSTQIDVSWARRRLLWNSS